jgi:hypothetical protein
MARFVKFFHKTRSALPACGKEGAAGNFKKKWHSTHTFWQPQQYSI